MIKFKATQEQIVTLATNAINASSPMGMGFMHFKPKVYTESEVLSNVGNILSIDYFEGRMVKLRIGKEDGFFIMNEPHIDYQSWAMKYNELKDLLTSAGIIYE